MLWCNNKLTKKQSRDCPPIPTGHTFVNSVVSNVPTFLLLLLVQFFFFLHSTVKELKSKESQLVSQTDLHAVCLADFSISACWAYCHCREEPCYTPDCVVAVFLTFSSIRALFKCLLFVHKLVKLVGTSNIRLFSYPGLTGTLISRCRCAGVTGWFLLTQCHQAPCEWHGARVCTGL